MKKEKTTIYVQHYEEKNEAYNVLRAIAAADKDSKQLIGINYFCFKIENEFYDVQEDREGYYIAKYVKV